MSAPDSSKEISLTNEVTDLKKELDELKVYL